MSLLGGLGTLYLQAGKERKKDCENWRLVKRLTEWSRRGVDGRRWMEKDLGEGESCFC